LQQIKDDAIKSVQQIVKTGKLSGLADFDLPKFNQYRLLLEQAMMEQYLASKKSAADELGVKIPQTPATTKTYIKTQAEMVASKQKQDLIFVVKSEITKELRKVKFSTTDLGLVDIIARISSAFSNYLTNKVSLATDTAIVGAINTGRRDVFESAPAEIAQMEYSAIIDGRTSPLCRSLDGSVLSYEQYLASPWKPPVHLNCRSIWVAYKKDDSFIPDVTGIKPPAGVTEPLLHDHNDHLDLSDAMLTLDSILLEVTELHADTKKLAELEERVTNALDADE
jgi:SPP1 gp7 family putative phage head morphogenesis protein